MEQKTGIAISEYRERQGGYSVRLMREEDVPQIAEVDREAFPSQWPPPPHTYKRELKNRLASYVVVTENGSTWENPNGASGGRRMISRKGWARAR